MWGHKLDAPEQHYSGPHWEPIRGRVAQLGLVSGLGLGLGLGLALGWVGARIRVRVRSLFGEGLHS